MATDYDALVLRAETAANNAAASAEQAAADRQAVEQLTLTINNEQAVSIQNSKEEIRQAIVAKGQECDTSVAFADYADKILSITTEAGGVDTSNDTVTADSMLLGVTAHNAAGVQITGTIATSTPTIDDNLITIPAGHIASATTLTVDEAATATVSDNTVTINKGYTSKEYAVSVATAGAVVTDRNVVTVPKGWHDGSTVTLVSRSLPNISIAVDSDSGRVTASYTAEEGWHNAGTIDAAETLDVQSAQTYIPGTADITIPAYKFLTGAQTIKGEPNLIAENIPSDMNFFGIQGTREIGTTGEGGSCKFYECATSTETEGTPEVKAGITVSGATYEEKCNGHYSLTGELQTYATARWKNDTTGYLVYKCDSYDYWVMTNVTQASDPGNSYFYADFHEGTPPWEESWQVSMGDGTLVVTGSLEDIPAVPGEKVWSGYEWSLEGTAYEKSSTITEGLSWTSVKPEVGKTYTEDALVEVASLYQVIDESSSSSSSSSSGEVEDSSSSSSSSSDGSGTDTPETTFGNVLTLSGVGTGTNSELQYGADVAMNGEYTIVDATATGTDREWRMTGSNGTTYSVYWDGESWGVGTYAVTDDAYSNIFYPNEYNTENPWIDENTSLTFWAGPNNCSYVKLLPKAISSDGGNDDESSSSSDGTQTTDVVRTVTVSGCGNGYAATSDFNGDYTIVDDSATGSDRVWKRTGTDATYTIEKRDYQGGYSWCILREGSMQVYTDSVGAAYFPESPWNADGTSFTWYDGPYVNSEIQIVPKQDASSGGNGEQSSSSSSSSSDEQQSSSESSSSSSSSDGNTDSTSFVVTGIESPSELNGTYNLVQGSVDERESCRWENGVGGVVTPYGMGTDIYWMMWQASESEPENPGMARFYNNSLVGLPWEGSWETRYGTGTAIVTQGSGSNGDSTVTPDIVFTVSRCSTEKANGGYWLTNEGTDGYNRIFTNGSVYCIGYTEMYDVNTPEAGYSRKDWYICEGSSYDNKGTIYAAATGLGIPTSNPWDCQFTDDLTGTDITVEQVIPENTGSTGTYSEILIVSGSYDDANNVDGEYVLKDPTATGLDKVYEQVSGDYKLGYTSIGWGFYLNDDKEHHVNYYSNVEVLLNDDGSSVTWYYQGGTCSLNVTKKN